MRLGKILLKYTGAFRSVAFFNSLSPFSLFTLPHLTAPVNFAISSTQQPRKAIVLTERSYFPPQAYRHSPAVSDRCRTFLSCSNPYVIYIQKITFVNLHTECHEMTISGPALLEEKVSSFLRDIFSQKLMPLDIFYPFFE